MLLLISLGDLRLKLGEIRTETGQKKVENHIFGYKLHVKTDIDHGLIRELETTTANVHDSQIDLSKTGEIV